MGKKKCPINYVCVCIPPIEELKDKVEKIFRE